VVKPVKHVLIKPPAILVKINYIDNMITFPEPVIASQDINRLERKYYVLNVTCM